MTSRKDRNMLQLAYANSTKSIDHSRTTARTRPTARWETRGRKSEPWWSVTLAVYMTSEYDGLCAQDATGTLVERGGPARSIPWCSVTFPQARFLLRACARDSFQSRVYRAPVPHTAIFACVYICVRESGKRERRQREEEACISPSRNEPVVRQSAEIEDRRNRVLPS